MGPNFTSTRITARSTARLLALALLAGCSGSVESLQSPAGPASGSSSSTPGAATGSAAAALACTTSPADSGKSLLRRLSNTEYQLTTQDLFALAEPPAVDKLPADNTKDGFKTFAEVQSMSAQHLRAYIDKARELADALLADSARRTRVVACDASKTTCVRDFVARFGKLAFRRALSSTEIESYAVRAEANALDADDRIRYAIQALLISPNFLYRVEIGDKPDALSTLSAYELATRLSFGLWGRAPNLELLTKAEQGELDTSEQLREVAKAMLGDERASYFYTSFFRQWLGYDTLRAPNVKPADWNDALLAQMQTETDTVLRQHAFGDGPFLDALTTNQTRVSPALASFYKLSAPNATGELSIPANHPRANAGVLGHASLMSMKTDGDKIAVRGNWLRRTFFCAPLSIPPQVAADLDDLLVGLSPVQIVAKRNTESNCKGCHAKIDPIGISLARFDATGRYDATVDVSQYGIGPTLPDLNSKPINSLADLASALTSAPNVTECLSQKVFVFMNGREVESADGCAVSQGHEALDEAGSFRALLAGIVASPSFRLRRADDASTAGATKP